MVAQIQPQFYTLEEYLALEAIAEDKHEYRDGEIVPMTGGSTDHNDIAGNLYAHLKSALRQQPYIARISVHRPGSPISVQ